MEQCQRQNLKERPVAQYLVLVEDLKLGDRFRPHNTRDQGMKMDKTQSQEDMADRSLMQGKAISLVEGVVMVEVLEVLEEVVVEALQEVLVQVLEAIIMLGEEEDTAQEMAITLEEVSVPDLLKAVKVFHLDHLAAALMMWSLQMVESGSGL